jgi:hypothetical protein
MFDAIYEGVEIPDLVAAKLGVLTACRHAPASPLQTSGPAGTVRTLCFADAETSRAWIASVSDAAQRGMRVIETTCLHGSRFWIQQLPRVS